MLACNTSKNDTYDKSTEKNDFLGSTSTIDYSLYGEVSA